MNIQPLNRNGHPVLPPSVILVTGGTGFVGTYVIRDLIAAGYKVKALRKTSPIPTYLNASVFGEVQWLDGDVMDPVGLEDSMIGTDAVIHTAAKVSFHENDRDEMFNVNLEGTANVVNAALEKNIKRFIHVSSVASLGKRKDGTIVNEDNKWIENKLNTNYAISKHYGEMEVWRGIAEGLPALIVNPSTILGYGDWNSSSCALFKNVYKGIPWYTNGVNGFVDIEDVSRAIVMLLATNIQSERFILNGENWSYRKLLNTIADGLEKKRPYKEATPILASMAWRLEKIRSLFTGRKAMITRESAKISRSNTNFDNSKILRSLPGFSFTKLDETIKNACAKYLIGAANQ